MEGTNKKRLGMISCEDLEKWSGKDDVQLDIQLAIKAFQQVNTNDNGDDNIEWSPILGIVGKLPSKEELSNFDGFIVLGSHYSVNEDKEWIKNMEEFVKDIKKAQSENGGRPRLVGLCFGHQLISKALGGKVDNNPSGRFVFRSEEIDIHKDLQQKSFFEKVFGEGKEKLKLLQSHGEVVTALPHGSKNVGSSNTCKHEVVMHGDDILTMQGHPEYNVELIVRLILPALKSKNIISEEEERKSHESFKLNLDSVNTLILIKEFLKNT